MAGLHSPLPQHAFAPFARPLVKKELPLSFAHYTVAHTVSCQGIGVHSGLPVTLTLSPAFPKTGITFVRTDLGGQEVKASWDTIVDTRLCTTVGNAQGVTIATTEHLLAALSAYGIDNIRIEIDGPELPIMDGSAFPFMRLLQDAGLRQHHTPRKIIRVLKEVTVEDGHQRASLSPSSSYEIEVNFDFGGRNSLHAQHCLFRPSQDTFLRDIAPARTFGLLEDAHKIWAMGLAKGASLENTLVYEGTDILNEDGSRYPDECVRHKVLDVMGDLHLAGGLILGKFYGLRPGHSLHAKLLNALFSDPTAWETLKA